MGTSRAAPAAVQCMERKSEINRMFTEQLFPSAISASMVVHVVPQDI